MCVCARLALGQLLAKDFEKKLRVRERAFVLRVTNDLGAVLWPYGCCGIDARKFIAIDDGVV